MSTGHSSRSSLPLRFRLWAPPSHIARAQTSFQPLSPPTSLLPGPSPYLAIHPLHHHTRGANRPSTAPRLLSSRPSEAHGEILPVGSPLLLPLHEFVGVGAFLPIFVLTPARVCRGRSALARILPSFSRNLLKLGAKRPSTAPRLAETTRPGCKTPLHCTSLAKLFPSGVQISPPLHLGTTVCVAGDDGGRGYGRG